MPATEQPILMTIEQVAASIGCKITTAKGLYRDGYLKAVRLGGTDKDPRQLRFTRAAVEEAVAKLPTYDPTAAVKGGA